MYADVLRCVATFAVISIHTSYPLFYRYAELPLLQWLAVNFWESCSRWAVPVFFMLSGMLLLNPVREESIKTILLKRVPKLVIPLLLWSEVYLLWINRDNIIHHQPIPFWEGLRWIYHTHVFLHLWFLYTLIGIYLSIPLARLVAKYASNVTKLYLVIGWLVLNGILGMITFFTEVKPGIEVPAFSLYLGYFLLGAWLSDFSFTRPQRMAVYGAAAAGFSLIFFGTYYLKSHGQKLEGFYDYASPGVMLTATGLFVWARYVAWEKWLMPGSWARKAVKKVSALTFGIYLSHVLVLEILSTGFFTDPIAADIVHPLFGVPALSLGVFCICLLLTYLLRLVPVLRWLVP